MVPRSELDELNSRYSTLEEFVRENTVSTDAFTDVVSKFDELEATIHSEYVARNKFDDISEKLCSSEETLAQLKDTHHSLEQSYKDALSELESSEQRYHDNAERLDRCRLEMKVSGVCSYVTYYSIDYVWF